MLAKKRNQEIENLGVKSNYLERINREIGINREESFMVSEDVICDMRNLPF